MVLLLSKVTYFNLVNFGLLPILHIFPFNNANFAQKREKARSRSVKRAQISTNASFTPAETAQWEP